MINIKLEKIKTWVIASIAFIIAVVSIFTAKLLTQKKLEVQKPQAETITVVNDAVDDTYVSSKSSGSNFGTDSTLISSRAKGDTSISYLKFDLSSLTGETLTGAYLRIIPTRSSNSVDHQVKLVDNSWVGKSITWDNKPSLGNVISSYSQNVSPGETTDIPLDYTKFQDRGGGLISIAVEPKSNNTSLEFSSRENSFGTPQLVVTYSKVIASPTPTIAEGYNCSYDFSIVTPTPTSTPTPTKVQDCKSSFPGAIYTTDATGSKVNLNIYRNKEDVYIHDDPNNHVPDGDYYYLVTEPPGDASSRILYWPYFAPDAYRPVTITNANLFEQLIPFETTSNPGNVYKAWLTDTLEFPPQPCSKTDVFKVIPENGTSLGVKSSKRLTGYGFNLSLLPILDLSNLKNGVTIYRWDNGSTTNLFGTNGKPSGKSVVSYTNSELSSFSTRTSSSTFGLSFTDSQVNDYSSYTYAICGQLKDNSYRCSDPVHVQASETMAFYYDSNSDPIPFPSGDVAF